LIVELLSKEDGSDDNDDDDAASLSATTAAAALNVAPSFTTVGKFLPTFGSLKSRALVKFIDLKRKDP